MRPNVVEYATLRRRIDRESSHINETHGDTCWKPVHHFHGTYRRTLLAGLYRAAELALVTPFRDGMNLVSKEYVMAQDPEKPGVLTLSRFAGAAVECEGALLIDPTIRHQSRRQWKRAFPCPWPNAASRNMRHSNKE
jgi:trehalose 6-phosphate synthase